MGDTSSFPALAFLRGDMAERVRAFDWARTPLGPFERWPASLRSVVATMLECQLPMYLAWGEEHIQIFNDAYRPILGDKAEPALGGRASETWAEIWPTIGPMWQQALSGAPMGFDDFKLTIDRFGYPEDVFFNFSYSAVRDDAGRAAGVLVTFAETTGKVQASRRLAFLDALAQATRTLTEPADVMRVTAERLGRHLGANRCAYATVRADQDTFDVIGDFNDGVSSIVGTYRFGDFGQEVLRLMRADQAFVNHDVDRDPATADTDRSAYARTNIQSVICVPLHKEGRFVAAMGVHQREARHWTEEEIALVKIVVARCWEALERTRAEAALREEARTLETLNRTGAALSAELDIGALVQRVTDAATELTGARFGAFFYNGVDEQGEAYLLYALSGADRKHFDKLGHPRPTALFGPTFRGEPTIRLDDVMADARYGQWGPHHGKPPGHLPVRSYLAVPVISRSGEVLGGLFFGHEDVGVFTERSERLAEGIASQADRLQQVVSNLLSNAIKFTPRGGEVRVLLRGGASHVDLLVEDTGMGIPPVFLPHVFERFRQADGSMARRHGGLGLGLSIVRNLVELHGGDVRAESAGEGQGARFIVTLPAILTRDLASASPDPGAADRISLKGARILVVDDDETVREMVARALGLQGAQVIAAASGAEALDVLPGADLNLLISDLGMPEMTGFELLSRVRALPAAQGGDIRAITLTAFAREIDQRQALEAGFQAHFRKPVEFSALVRAIQAMGLS